MMIQWVLTQHEANKERIKQNRTTRRENNIKNEERPGIKK
jgi:hypothetical protein